MLYIVLAVAIVLVLVVVARLRRRTTGSGAPAHQFTDDPHRRHNQFDPATGAIIGGVAMHDAQQSPTSADSGGWGSMNESSGSFDSGSGGSFDGGSASVD